jgi:hypothetical protein
MRIRTAHLVAVTLAIAGLAGCLSMPAKEQRTTQGPTAEQLWVFRVATQNGREPTFEERQHWLDQLDARIARYLAEHPAAANSFEVSTFRHLRQAAVGMSKEQVLILLGAAHATSVEAAEMETLARRYWPEIKSRATEVWVYPLGWRLYFAGTELVDITQYVPERSLWGGAKEEARATTPPPAR